MDWKKPFQKSQYLLALLLLITSLSLHAQSSVWMIEKNGNRVYLGGTIHLLHQSEYPLPEEFEIAYKQSSKVVFETDIKKLQSPEYQNIMMRELTYSDGQNLKQVLSTETYQSLEEYFAIRGVPMDNIVNFKVGMVISIMLVVELQRLGLNGEGVDFYFNNKSFTDNKSFGQLESVDQQIEFLAGLGVDNEDALIQYSLTDIKSFPIMWPKAVEAWRSGNSSIFDEMQIKSLQENFPNVYQTILVDRNNAWLPQIEALLDTKEIEFILVGVLHTSGEDGLLNQLANRGYQITQLQ